MKTVPVDEIDPLAWTKNTVIPDGCGIPFGANMTMAAMIGVKKFGAAVLKFLTVNYPIMSGGYFKPKGDGQKEAVRKAAIALFEQTHANGKKK